MFPSGAGQDAERHEIGDGIVGGDGASDKIPGFPITADDVTLCLGRVSGVDYKPKRGEATPPREASADAS